MIRSSTSGLPTAWISAQSSPVALAGPGITTHSAGIAGCSSRTTCTPRVPARTAARPAQPSAMFAASTAHACPPLARTMPRAACPGGLATARMTLVVSMDGPGAGARACQRSRNFLLGACLPGFCCCAACARFIAVAYALESQLFLAACGLLKSIFSISLRTRMLS